MKDPTGRYDLVGDRNHRTYRLGVAHETHHKACRAIQELDLDGAFPIGFGSALAASQFQKIIILCDYSKYAAGKDWIGYLSTKLPPGGQLIDLS